LGAILFYSAIGWCTDFFLHTIAGYFPPAPAGEGETIVRPILRPWLLPVVTTIGGLISGAIVYTLAPEAEGHGTDAAIESFHHRGGRVRRRIPLIKLVASAITIGSGGSGGREGPTAQISSGFGSALADLLHLNASDRRIALATGMGAGIGAIFRAPLGGAMMAAEIMYKHDLEVEVIIPSLIASIVGYSIFGWWTGWSPVFGSQPELGFDRPLELIPYAALGVLCGLVGIVYARTFYGVEHLFHRLHLPRIVKPALGGLLVGLLGMAIPEALHTGYGWVQIGMSPDVLALPLWLVLVLPFAKILATALSIGSGGSGGIFGPGMVIGGLLGSALWRLGAGWMPGLPASAAPFAIVGMMATFGSIAHAPLAVMLMVAEMTGNLSLLAPAMVALGLATLVVGEETIYTSQLPTRADSPAHRYRFSFPLLSTLTVRAAMGPASPRPPEADTAPDAAERGTRAVPETVAAADAAAANEGGLAVEPNETLDDALQEMAEHGVSALPVVEPATGQVLGTITVAGLLQAYRQAVRRGSRRLGSLVEGTTLVETRVEAGAPLAGQKLAAAGVPAGTVVMAIHRHGEALVPRGDTMLQPNDVLTLVVTPAGEEAVRDWLTQQVRPLSRR
jgi:CIC family chloride channel protein